MTDVIVAPQAQADVTRIIDYLASVASPATAARWNDRLWLAIDGIGEFAAAGAPRPKLGKHVRIRIVTPYIVIYEHEKGAPAAYVLRVVHGKRQVTKKLLTKHR